MSEYTNTAIYVLLPNADNLPEGISLPESGEGANSGILKDGRVWYKNCFMQPEEMRGAVHAEDKGELILKSSAEMRAIKQADQIDMKPIDDSLGKEA